MSSASQPDLIRESRGEYTLTPEQQAEKETYRARLVAFLEDPASRQIEGFPIGENDAILALSDPPYYTACPNPFLGEILEKWQKEREALNAQQSAEEQKYHREPFAADVSEGKNDPIYNAHSYHTKVPHKAIMRYILHYTQPGDIVLDGFCGTGMTGVAAHSVTTLFYLIQKGKSSAEARATVTNLLQFIKIAPVNQSTIEQALNLDYRDFENAVQMISAVQCKVDCLVTRNAKDYRPALLPVVKPVDFLSTL